MTGASPLETQARRALISSVETFGASSAALILVGAQAIYFRTQTTKLAVAPATKDADFALDSRLLLPVPLLEELLAAAGFVPDPAHNNPGAWISSNNIPIDFLVPIAIAKGGRRSANIAPHSKSIGRLTSGLDAVLVDHSVESISAFDSPFETVSLKVAGEASLLISKLIKVSERLDGARFSTKDCHDIYRLLLATPTDFLASKIRWLSASDLAAASAKQAVQILKTTFASSLNSPGVKAAAAVEIGIGRPETVAQSLWALSNDLVEAIDID